MKCNNNLKYYVQNIAKCLVIAMLSACHGDDLNSPPPTQTVPVTVTISVNPANVLVGQNSTLSWSATNATSCTASGSWNGAIRTSGTETVSQASAGTAVYTLTCNGTNGSATAEAKLTTSTLPLSLKVPQGFTANTDLLGEDGAVTFNNFNNQYLHGGVLPAGGAEIFAASEALPTPPVSNQIALELSQENATVTSTGNTTVSGVNCTQIFYDTADTNPTIKNEEVYCPSSATLYKFFLAYYSDDPQAPQYLSTFTGMLGNVNFNQN